MRCFSVHGDFSIVVEGFFSYDLCFFLFAGVFPRGYITKDEIFEFWRGILQQEKLPRLG